MHNPFHSYWYNPKANLPLGFIRELSYTACAYGILLLYLTLEHSRLELFNLILECYSEEASNCSLPNTKNHITKLLSHILNRKMVLGEMHYLCPIASSYYIKCIWYWFSNIVAPSHLPDMCTHEKGKTEYVSGLRPYVITCYTPRMNLVETSPRHRFV